MPPLHSPGPRVLIVAADPRVAERAAARLGPHALAARDGPEAVVRAAADRPAVVVVDPRLPPIGPTGVADWVRAQGVPAVAADPADPKLADLIRDFLTPPGAA